MLPACPHCTLSDSIRHSGFYSRKSDDKILQRYVCRRCNKKFSEATLDPCFRQHKRHLNATIAEQLSSSMSQRRIALLLRINRITVVRKFLFVAQEAERELTAY